MTNTKFEVSMALRQMIAGAVAVGVVSPNGIVRYLEENGWRYDLPTRPTVEKILRDNGVTYVNGYWTKK